MKKIIGMDLDGILVNWNDGARPYFASANGGVDLCTATTPDRPTWNWPKHYGYSDEACKQAYWDMGQDTLFWATLGALPYCLETLQVLEDQQVSDAADVYFITTRPGKLSKFQTECWLEGQGYTVPTVLIAPSPQAKALLAAGLGLTHMIDDRTENCLEIRKASPQTQVFCLSAGWNLEHHKLLVEAGVNIVQSLADYVKVLSD